MRSTKKLLIIIDQEELSIKLELSSLCIQSAIKMLFCFVKNSPSFFF